MRLRHSDLPTAHDASAIRRETVFVPMRDGVRLATDLHLPPVDAGPVIVLRTPYSRAGALYGEALTAFAQAGWIGVAQDCRGTGDSEPDEWHFYLYETEDGHDCVEWVTRQPWCDGFVGGIGGSYDAGTQWCMATHPAMSAVAPEVGGMGVAPRTGPRLHMFLNAYARTVGKGDIVVAEQTDDVIVDLGKMEQAMLGETLATGYFNEPLRRPFPEALLDRYPDLRSAPYADAQRRLHERFCSLPAAERVELAELALGKDGFDFVDSEALVGVFGPRAHPDALLVPGHDHRERVRALQAPALLLSGWYDWGLDDTLATWELLSVHAQQQVRTRSRLVIAGSAHGGPGYREGGHADSELGRFPGNTALLLHWYRSVRNDDLASWPPVVYYLMGADEWRAADAWPLPDAATTPLYLHAAGTLSADEPAESSTPDRYTYDPEDPTPTAGGSIVSFVYEPGSVDVSEIQQRPDVLTYTTEPLEDDLDVVGPLRLVLYASSSAIDTDFAARLSDVFPDGRAIQLQNGVLRTRHRNVHGEPELLEPGRVHRLEIDMWATANRFTAGHRLRVDISSADFPRYDRNTNLGGEDGAPVRAEQTIHHDAERPSHLLLPVVS
jgi:predicted acyl esterase